MRRSHRLAIIMHELLTHPGRLVPLGSFADRLGAAKSSLSEDLALVRQVFAESGVGEVGSVPGVTGGVVFRPILPAARMAAVADEFCRRLADPRRILPGGFLYLTDLVSDPLLLSDVGELFATRFRALHPEGFAPDAVVTVETRGIPVALMTARALGTPLVIIRRQALLTEGPVVTVNYLSGSRRVETMSLPRRALAESARVVLVDDFMKAGGTVRGMLELMEEFGARVLGVAVLVETAQPAEKPISGYLSLARLHRVDEAARLVEVEPAPWLRDVQVASKACPDGPGGTPLEESTGTGREQLVEPAGSG